MAAHVDAAAVQAVRAHFPSLKTHAEWTFADNAGGSQVLRGVAERVSEYLLTTSVQLGATYDISSQAAARVKEGHVAAAALFNAAHPYEVFAASSSSMAAHNIASAMAPTLTPEHEIIVTNFDHEANVGAWIRMAEVNGATVKHWEIDRTTLRPSLETLQSLLSPRTRLVACSHCSNILGTVNDVAKIAALVHTIPGAELVYGPAREQQQAARGWFSSVDGVAYAPHRRIDVQALGVDYYIFSVYKVYGPHFSIFYGRREAVARLSSINHSFLNTEPPENHPYKLQPGGVNFELLYSLPAIVQYLSALGVQPALAPNDAASTNASASSKPVAATSAVAATPAAAAASTASALAAGFAWVTRQEQALMDRFMPFLMERQAAGVLKIIGEPTADQAVRVPTVSFVVKGVKSSVIPPLVDKHKIGIRWGHFYSKRLIDYLGLAEDDGVVRVSLVHYNTVEEVDRLVAVLRTVLAELPAATAGGDPAKGGYGI